MSKLSERGVVHLLLPLILILGLIAGVYLVTSSNPLKLFSRATSAPVSPPISPYVCGVYFRKVGSLRMIQGSWSNDPQATSSIRACYDYLKNNIFNKPNCAQPDGEYATGVLMQNRKFTSNFDMPSVNMSTEFVANQYCPKPTPTSTPTETAPPSATPTSTPAAATHVVLYAHRDIVPDASGDVWIQVLNYNMGTDLGTVRINGTLRQLMPNRIYKVYLCGSDGSTCATNANPQIRTNAFGTVSFDQLTFDIYNRSTNSVSDVKVLESPPSGPLRENTCYLATAPCLSGGYTMPRLYNTPTVISCSACGADANKNGKVDIIDMMRVAQCMRIGYSGSAPGNYSCRNADANGDNKIDASDLNCAREQFGKQCTGPRR